MSNLGLCLTIPPDAMDVIRKRHRCSDVPGAVSSGIVTELVDHKTSEDAA